MNEEKKNKKPYEPPRIYDIGVDLHQAMGQTNCPGGATPNNCPGGSGVLTTNCPMGTAANACATGYTH
jgi:hypothetical protein